MTYDLRAVFDIDIAQEGRDITRVVLSVRGKSAEELIGCRLVVRLSLHSFQQHGNDLLESGSGFLFGYACEAAYLTESIAARHQFHDRIKVHYFSSLLFHISVLQFES